MVMVTLEHPPFWPDTGINREPRRARYGDEIMTGVVGAENPLSPAAFTAVTT